MARMTKIYDLLFSCPGDVYGECYTAVEKAVEKFNKDVDKSFSIGINLKHWSTDSYPQSGGHPQELLNSQIVDNSDAAIAIFWTRFGTPTDKYASGTEEEIERLIKNKKQVFLYFYDKGVPPSMTDLENYKEQREKITAFKNRYKEGAIYWVVNDTTELQEQLTNHLKLFYCKHNDTSKIDELIYSDTERSAHIAPPNIDVDFKISSDDEAVALYYILTKKMRKIKKGDIIAWMKDEELYDVNIDNAFDLLSTLGNNGKYTEDVLELDSAIFRQYSNKSEDLIPNLYINIEKYRKLSRDTFNTMWQSGLLDDALKLFISYIIDEHVTNFGCRWKADLQIDDIKMWELKYDLDNTLSENYCSCLTIFIENRLVFESEWTSFNNPRQYSLCSSLEEYLFGPNFQYVIELQIIKNNHILLPF